MLVYGIARLAQPISLGQGGGPESQTRAGFVDLNPTSLGQASRPETQAGSYIALCSQGPFFPLRTSRRLCS